MAHKPQSEFWKSWLHFPAGSCRTDYRVKYVHP